VRAALDAFRRIVQALRSGGAAGGAPLSSAQLFALQLIAAHPNASINDLAALTFTHQSSVSVVIQRLVEQGLVAKGAASEDRRRQRLAVTAAGRRVLRRAPAAVQERLIAAIAALPPADRRTLARLLDAIVGAVAVDGAARPAPMFFEDGAAGAASAAGRRAGSRPAAAAQRRSAVRRRAGAG
jgi:DNA-binding MarR family transcriptional regulator